MFRLLPNSFRVISVTEQRCPASHGVLRTNAVTHADGAMPKNTLFSNHVSAIIILYNERNTIACVTRTDDLGVSRRQYECSGALDKGPRL